MKLHYYPALWCLLFVFLGSLNGSFAANSSIENGIENAENESTSINLYATNPIPARDFVVPVIRKTAWSNTAITKASKEDEEKGANAYNEEISYKNNLENNSLSENILTNNPEIANAETSDTKTSFKQGMYYGVALMLLFINLVCFVIFDEKLFMFYTLALGGVLAVFFYNDGLLGLFGIASTENPFLLQSLLLWVAVGFSALFASKYLNLEEFFPKLKFITSPLLVVAGGLVISAFLMDNTVTGYTANFVSLSILGCYFVAGVLLFSKKNYAKFYAIASFIPLVFAIDFFVLKNIGINFLSTDTVHIKVAGLVEMLILTYAIVYRMRAIKEEHVLRQTEMRIFLKRQETLNRQSAVKLMEEVYLENLIMHYDLDGLQIKLLQYISEGKDNAKIARKLKTTEQEIEFLTKELYNKLEISEQIQEDYRLLDTQPDYLYN